MGLKRAKLGVREPKFVSGSRSGRQKAKGCAKDPTRASQGAKAPEWASGSRSGCRGAKMSLKEPQ